MAFPSYTYTFTNGSTADATQVNQDFSDILNGISDTTKDISVNNATTAGTTTLNGNVTLGNATNKTITFNGSVASSIPVSANTSWDFGSATLGMKSVYIGGTSTFTTRIMSAATASWTLTLPTTAGSAGNVLKTDGSGNTSWLTVNNTNSPNLLINSAFDYWQVGTSATVAATGGGTPSNTYLYQADQWYVNNILGGGTVEGIITYSQVTGVTNGSLFGAKVQITTAPTGTGIQNGCEFYQPLSNRTSAQLYGQTASFTILVKAFGNVNQVGIQFYYATSEVKLTNSIGSEVLTSVNTSTFTSCTINGQALGTSMTTSGIVGVRIRITGVSSGNTYDVNNGFVCEQAMLNLGSVANTTFMRQYSDPADEFNACMYFYEKSYNKTTAPASTTQTGAVSGINNNTAASFTMYVSIPYKATKRNSPTPTIYSTNGGATASYRDVTGAANGSITNIASGENSFYISLNTLAAQHQWEFQWSGDARI